jgi:hypothetical protein
MIASCIVLLWGSIQSIEKEVTKDEIAAVGTGFQIFHNLGGGEKFAIVQPPLPGIMSYTILSSTYQLQNIAAIPSGNYFDMVSFIFALETPKVIGNEILLSVGEENFKKIRYVNLLLVATILYIISRKSISLVTILAITLYPFTDILMTGTTEALSGLLVMLLLDGMISSMSYVKFTIVGLIIGLLIATAGTSGMILAGAAILSQIVFIDIKKKRLSKGFKREWVIGTFLIFTTATTIAWICYGMDLACYCQLESLLGLEPSSSIRIVPFFDSMKQTLFDIIFSTNDHKYSFSENISNFFNRYNIIIAALNVFFAIKKLSHYGIFSLVSLFCIFLYNDSQIELIRSFFDTMSVVLTITLTLQLKDYIKS